MRLMFMLRKGVALFIMLTSGFYVKYRTLETVGENSTFQQREVD